MTLIIDSGFNGITEPEVATYIAAVEAADGQLIEFAVANAVNEFVLNCKNDGTWDKLNLCLILCGARTIDGALVPLKGPAPANVNLTSTEYDRENGLSGNSTASAYLNTNYNAASDPQDDYHCSIYCTTRLASVTVLDAGAGASGSTTIGTSGSAGTWSTRSRSNLTNTANTGNAPVFVGLSRNAPLEFSQRTGSIESVLTRTSASPFSRSYWLFATSNSSTPSGYNNSRVSFVSAGRSVNLGQLESRVSTLTASIGAAIP